VIDMTDSCSHCGNKIGFLDIKNFDDMLVCNICYKNLLKLRRNWIFEQIIKEIDLKKDSLDDNIKTKLMEIHNLVGEGILNEYEFEDMKNVLIKKKQNVTNEGRMHKLWKMVQEEAKKRLVAPASAKFPDLKVEFITFDDSCNEHQFLIVAYVDSQARSSALLRLSLKAKCDYRANSVLYVKLRQKFL
jgi:hypothetical protein